MEKFIITGNQKAIIDVPVCVPVLMPSQGYMASGWSLICPNIASVFRGFPYIAQVPGISKLSVFFDQSPPGILKPGAGSLCDR